MLSVTQLDAGYVV